MPDPPVDSDLTSSSSNAYSSSSKYLICDVKYDRSGELIRDAKGSPTQFCNKHDSQISAMFDRAISAIEKQQHQSAMQSADNK